jgi:hypothetical protein
MLSRVAMLVGLGRLREADQVTDSLLEMNRDFGLSAKLQPVFAGLLPADSVADISTMLSRAPLTFPQVAMTRANLDLSRGDHAAAKRVLDEALRQTGPMYTDEFKALLRAYRGWAEVVAGDTAGGLAKIDQGLRESGNLGINWASSNLRFHYAGILASRAATRERGIMLLKNTFNSGPDIMVLPLTFLLAGRALEDAGRRAEAAESYSQFIRLWSGADSSLQGRVDEARDGLARVTAEQ